MEKQMNKKNYRFLKIYLIFALVLPLLGFLRELLSIIFFKSISQNLRISSVLFINSLYYLLLGLSVYALVYITKNKFKPINYSVPITNIGAFIIGIIIGILSLLPYFKEQVHLKLLSQFLFYFEYSTQLLIVIFAIILLVNFNKK